MRHGKIGSFLMVTLLMVFSAAAESEQTKTVLGPKNIYLADGANALKAGNGEDGVRLTLLGLKTAHGAREEKIAHSNLCAGFVLIDQPNEALEHCNWVLERDPLHWRTYNNRALAYMDLKRFDEAEEDIQKGQSIRPKSQKLKIVKGMYLDETHPVTPQIEVDERRRAESDVPEELTDSVVE